MVVFISEDEGKRDFYDESFQILTIGADGDVEHAPGLLKKNYKRLVFTLIHVINKLEKPDCND